MHQNVRNIWCSVLNYQDTANEANTKAPTEPTFFLKAGSSLVGENQAITLPSFSQTVLYEVELALKFNKDLQVEWIGLALDLTAWDTLEKLEANSFPWTLAKSFKNSCPIGSFIPLQNIDELENLNFKLEVNGILRQNGNTRNMVFSCKKLVSYLLDHFPVCPYDLVLTGTPSGVAQVKKGDQLTGKIGNQYTAKWIIS